MYMYNMVTYFLSLLTGTVVGNGNCNCSTRPYNFNTIPVGQGDIVKQNLTKECWLLLVKNIECSSLNLLLFTSSRGNFIKTEYPLQ